MPSNQAILNIPPRNIDKFQKEILRWFSKNGRSFPWRKKSISLYQKIISEVFLQRTKAETVKSFYKEFFYYYPTWKSVSLAPEKDLQVILKPLGLWRRRATVLRNLSGEMVKKNGRFPKIREEIEKLPGVGQYIANSILLFCHGIPQPLLDVNMARVLERVFGKRKLVDIRYDPYLQNLSKKVVECKDPDKINWAILDLAASTCLPRRPLCEKCPLFSICQWTDSTLN